MAVPAFLVGVFSLLAGPAWGATDDIHANPPHLVLAEGGPPGSATITWDTSTPIVEVWASRNGGPRKLISRSLTSGRHSKLVDFIKPGYTVFSLHKGRTAQPQNHAPAGRFLDYTSVTTQPPPASTFGLAYWPVLETNASTLGQRWPSLVPTVARDLDLIASMGAGVVRLIIWPLGNSWTGDPGAWKIVGGPGGDEIRQTVLTRQATNLVELIKLCRDRGLKVTITFANTYLRRGPRAKDRMFEWEWAYPPEDGGWEGFVRDALSWVNGYVTRIESNVDPSVRSTVIAYDIQNEVSPHVFPYFTYLYDHSAVPRGKRGVSVLTVSDHASALKNALDGRHLDYVEYHSYPGGSNPQIQAAYNTLTRVFPDSTVYLGEFGQATQGTCTDPSLEERSQAQTIISKIIQAKSSAIPYFVHWMLWNYSPPYQDQVLGLGYEPHCPKDALGSTIGLTTLLSNPDMEEVADGRPLDWRVGGKGAQPTFTVNMSARGSAQDVAATNRRYARVKVENPPGSAWLRSLPIAVRGGDRLSVNAYVRSDMKAVGLGVTQIRADRSVVKTAGPAFTPSEWSWSSWLHRVGPWSVCLDPRAAMVIVTVRGRAEQPGSAHYLDVDTVSAATARSGSCA